MSQIQYDEQSFEKDIRKILNDLGDVLIAKNKDYGNNVEKNIDKWGYPSIAIRLDDKLSRFENLIKEGSKRQVADETVADTLLDLAGYSILGYRKLKKEEAFNAYDSLIPETSKINNKNDGAFNYQG